MSATHKTEIPDHLRQQAQNMVEQGWVNNMEELIADQMLRYKYLPVDDSFKEPFDKKGALSVIKDGTIKFSHAKEFNDPFDCYPDIDKEELSKYFSGKKGFLKNIGNELGLSPAQRIQEKPKQIKRLKSFSNPLEILNNQIGICSLSRNPLNLLMWAHYATSHSGFVVEFSIPIKPTSFDDLLCLVPFPVQYKKEKPKIISPKSFKEYVLTKGEDWEYEQEERVIDFDRRCGIHPYDRKQILKSVIAGMRMSDDDFSILKKSVDAVNTELGINVVVHKAEPLQGKFALFVQDRDDFNIHDNES
ncbi:DUF2971 domain-containing protein [Methylobacter sp.]|uniref:DUF2971 domain-containing protein n=1 Tax=Methylobacter sp. TaxID=2051955 RepID=UPI002FDE32E3